MAFDLKGYTISIRPSPSPSLNLTLNLTLIGIFNPKGCTFKRRALNEDQLNSSLSGKVATLRDWEWMDIAMEAPNPNPNPSPSPNSIFS